jgi:16S rRNA (uracil1498-N3)-methyltransferase
MHRFYVAKIGSEDRLWLEGAEARHLSRVLRICVGDEVGVFDGSGVECVGVVAEVGRARAQIEILRREKVSRDPAINVTLGCALVKSRAMALVVEKCCELGLQELVPVETRRSVPKVADRDAAHLERWRRYAIEASKQCGRTTITRIAAPRPLRAFLARADDYDVALVCSPDGKAPRLHEVLDGHEDAKSVGYLIGPEGGLEPDEMSDAAAYGFKPVRLGKSTLRTETAAMAALTAILYHYER